MPGMPAKLDAQIKSLDVERSERQIQVSYAWCKSGKPGEGRALQWWLAQLKSPVTREALLGGHRHT